MTIDKISTKKKENYNPGIKGQVVLTGNIKLQSPMLIGNGSNDNTDIDLLVDNTGCPFIPATSFVGVLKDHLVPILEKDASLKSGWNQFWGYSIGENSHQSTLVCSDLTISNSFKPEHITIREGVGISRKNGMAEPNSKFNFEIVERKSSFNLVLKAFYSDNNQILIKKIFETIKYELEQEKIRVGAKTQNGLGKIKLEDTKLYEYKFSKQKDVLKYFKNLPTDVYDPAGKYQLDHNELTINAYFDIRTSVLSRSYSTDPKDPDSTHIKSKDKFVLPGTGLKGAVSSRAEKILRTKLKPDKAVEIHQELFGFVKKKNQLKSPDDKAAKRSRIRIEENVLESEKLSAELQNRIKIDRFTGGTIKAALFDSVPLFRKNKSVTEKIININISIDKPKEYETGLLLLVLKDLWTGDLPIGGEKNVGRGVLEGVNAVISNGNGLNIEVSDPNTLTENEKKKLQKYVDALNEEGQK